jgi:hypothetical protein
VMSPWFALTLSPRNFTSNLTSVCRHLSIGQLSAMPTVVRLVALRRD